MSQIVIDDTLYAKAEEKASVLHTSVPDIVAEYLRHWTSDVDERAAARAEMRRRFANPDWQFAVGELEGREERNARR